MRNSVEDWTAAAVICLWAVLSIAWLAFIVWAIYTLVTAISGAL